MAEEYDYLFKGIIVENNGVGRSTLVNYLNELIEQQTLEDIKKRYDKKIDEYHILRGS